MGCAASTEVVNKESIAKLDKLTSTAYTAKNPPAHWSDAVFLVPHEWLRREMAAMTKSVQALPESTTEENAWKAELFATWLSRHFGDCLLAHHDAEEKIYIPYMVEKGCKIQDRKISVDHKALVDELHELENLSKAIVDAKGLNCKDEIAKLKSKIPPFEKKMNAHLKEEELTLPPQIKEKITEAESDAQVQKVMASLALEALKVEMPGVIFALREWASETYAAKFEKEVPPPMVKIIYDIFMPNYKSYYCAMRDAPTLEEKPTLDQVPFDPSMLPPPPAEQPA